MSKKRGDPLHIPNSELVVMHRGKEALILNKRLLDKQNCWKNLDLIKMLHSRRLMVEGSLNNHKDRENLKDLLKIWTKIQFELQEKWGFPKDKRYHKFWTIPCCECPVMDNEDRYPTGNYIINNSCNLHGVGEKS